MSLLKYYLSHESKGGDSDPLGDERPLSREALIVCPRGLLVKGRALALPRPRPVALPLPPPLEQQTRGRPDGRRRDPLLVALLHPAHTHTHRHRRETVSHPDRPGYARLCGRVVFSRPSPAFRPMDEEHTPSAAS